MSGRHMIEVVLSPEDSAALRLGLDTLRCTVCGVEVLVLNEQRASFFYGPQAVTFITFPHPLALGDCPGTRFFLP